MKHSIMCRVLKPCTEGKFRLVRKVIKEGTILDCYDPAKGRFFKGTMPFSTDIVVLYEGGTLWMSDTPLEASAIMNHLPRACGEVLTFGLGIGLFPYLASKRRDVKRIDIIEQSPQIISLVFSQVGNRKMRVIQDDLFHYMENTVLRYDYIYLDIWADRLGLIAGAKKARAAAQRCLKPGGGIGIWLEELYDRVERQLPSKPLPSAGIGIHEPCLICSKKLRHDYAGLCMDCADGLGVSELFLKKYIRKEVTNDSEGVP